MARTPIHARRSPIRRPKFRGYVATQCRPVGPSRSRAVPRSSYLRPQLPRATEDRATRTLSILQRKIALRPAFQDGRGHATLEIAHWLWFGGEQTNGQSVSASTGCSRCLGAALVRWQRSWNQERIRAHVLRSRQRAGIDDPIAGSPMPQNGQGSFESDNGEMMRRIGSQQGRKPKRVKDEEGIFDIENADGRGTPGARGTKRNKHHHHQ